MSDLRSKDNDKRKSNEKKSFISELESLRIDKLNNEQLLDEERSLRQNQEQSFVKANRDLGDQIIKLEDARRENRSVAMDLIDDAIASKEALRMNEERMRWQKEAFQAAVSGAPLQKSLDIIASLVIQETKGEARTAFYMADEEAKHLHPVFGAGNMPIDYLREIDGFVIGEDSLACGLAIPTGRPILTTDVFEDPLWKDWTSIAEKYEYRGCWSFPIKTYDDKAVGTFAMYFKNAIEAKAEDLALADIVVQTAAVIISNYLEAEKRASAEEKLRKSEEKYRSKLEAEVNDRTAELRESRELLQAIINAPAIGIVVYKAIRDEQGNIIDFLHEYINRASVDMLGEDFTGKLLTDHGENGALQFPHFRKVIETGNGNKYVSETIFRGRKVWFSISNTPLEGERLVHTWEDITERKVSEAEILQLKDEIARRAEDKYRTLFNSLDEGFCIIEVMFNAQSKPYDWRFLEVNPAFEKNNGLVNATGKTILELTPDIEEKWFEIYGRVAQTGEPLRFEENSDALNRSFTLYAFPTGSPAQNQVAVLFKDTTDRTRRDGHLAFLAELSEDFSQLSDADEIMQTVSKKIGGYLDITTCNFSDVDEPKDLVTVHIGWNDPSVPSTVGSFRLSQYLTDEFKRASRAGETVVISNTQSDPRTDAAGYAALNMHSFVTVPFHSQGKWTHYIAICDSKAHDWRDDEVELIEEIANRIFPRLERARADEALLRVKENHLQELEREVRYRTADLNQSRDKLQSVLDTTLIQMFILEAVRDESHDIIDFRILVANKEFKKESGINDLVGKLYVEEYPWIRQAGLFDVIVNVIERGETQQLDYLYSHEGVNKWYSCMFVKLGDGVVASNIDITSRKQAEEDRFKNYLLMQQTENLALLGSWDYDLSSGNLSWSDGMYRLFKLEKGREVTPDIYLQYCTPDYEETAKRMVDSIKYGHTDFEEAIKVEIDGSIRALRIKVTSIKNDKGTGLRLLGVDMDITASLDAAEKMKQMEDEQQLEIFKVTLRTEEEERRRISESLHNGLGQMLYAIKLSLNQLKIEDADRDPEKYESSRQYTSCLLSDAIRDSRRISHELMPSVLEEFGLKAAVKDICQQMQGAVKFRCTIELEDGQVDKYMQLAIFRTLQELMLNVVKHARATFATAKIILESGNILLRVSDNGKGFDPTIERKEGIGLASIRSKVDLLNGDIDIESASGKGTTVTIKLPYSVRRKKPD